METIKIKAIDTPTEKMISKEDFILTLGENYISLHQQGYVEQDGKEFFFLKNCFFEKDKISGCQIEYNQVNEQYNVCVYCAGVSQDDDISLFFNDIEDAQFVYFKIQDWKFLK